MNEYGFDYMNYITNIPNSMNYTKQNQASMNFMTTNQPTFHQKTNQQVPISNQQIPMPNMMSSKPLSSQQLLEPTQGFLRGNMFGNLYEPYKNYKPAQLEPTNEKEALLYQLMQYKFALIDLDLYLDTHPNDSNTIALYNQYLIIEKQISEKYESMYGPLTLDSNYLVKNNWTWKNSPWPWEGV